MKEALRLYIMMGRFKKKDYISWSLNVRALTEYGNTENAKVTLVLSKWIP